MSESKLDLLVKEISRYYPRMLNSMTELTEKDVKHLILDFMKEQERYRKEQEFRENEYMENIKPTTPDVKEPEKWTVEQNGLYTLDWDYYENGVHMFEITEITKEKAESILTKLNS